MYTVPHSLRLLSIFLSLDGTSSERLKVCCTAQLAVTLDFLSLDGTSSERLKVCCTAQLAVSLVPVPRWH